MKLPEQLARDASTYGGKHTTERISASSLIPVGGTNFASMSSPEDLEIAKMSNPNAMMHDAVKRAFGWKGDDGPGLFESRTIHAARQPLQIKRLLGYADGATVRDKKEHRKGIIIKANAGYTKKTRRPVHRIADRHGNTWLAKESDLQLLS